MKMEMKIAPRPISGGGRFRGALLRFLLRVKEHELAERYLCSRTKKDESIGKRAELELKRKIDGGKDYQLVRRKKAERRERARAIRRMQKYLESFFMREPPMRHKPVDDGDAYG